jgi:tryptophan halogenase
VDQPAKTGPIRTIAICGAGLAGRMTAAALTRSLPPSIGITLVDCGPTDADLFYGNVTPPTAYEFNLNAGVTEPRLVLDTNTAFSWGSNYQRWGGDNRSWIQCYHLALPILEGVLFHHYLAREGLWDLQPYLIPALAARRGAFAHPPEKGPHPLARAEYGYQFTTSAYASLFAAAADPARLKTITAPIARIDADAQAIHAIHFADGGALRADLYVDCTGSDPALLSRLGAAFSGARRLRAAESLAPADRLGAPCRTITAESFGWRSDTPLRGAIARLTISDPETEADALSQHSEAPTRTAEATLGRFEEAWRGNCVAIGQAAGVVEPISPAPMLLLQRDIERLLSLIPVSTDMSIERREFNRHFAADYDLAGLFNRALFETDGLPETPYWRAARDEPLDERLARKIEQFESRGILVAYDLEPFNLEDWTILHCGMGRQPARYDPLADKAEKDSVRRYLETMRSDIEKVVATIPDHDAYMARLRQFLMTQQG